MLETLQPSFITPDQIFFVEFHLGVKLGYSINTKAQCCHKVLAAGESHQLKKRRSLDGFLAGDHLVKYNGHFHRQHTHARHFAPSLSRLNLIFSQEPNFLATTLKLDMNYPMQREGQHRKSCSVIMMMICQTCYKKVTS